MKIIELGLKISKYDRETCDYNCPFLKLYIYPRKCMLFKEDLESFWDERVEKFRSCADCNSVFDRAIRENKF